VKRQRLRKWAENNYSKDSVPTAKTLRKMANDGRIAGAIQDPETKYWYVIEEIDTLAEEIDAEIDALPEHMRAAALI